jgi:mRNA interferase HigB
VFSTAFHIFHLPASHIANYSGAHFARSEEFSPSATTSRFAKGSYSTENGHLLVISRKKLVEAAAQHPDASARLDMWYRVTKKAVWTSIADVRKTFSSADAVGTCTVFNIRGNAYRLISWINYETQKVFIKHVLTHADYDKEDWKNDCSSG